MRLQDLQWMVSGKDFVPGNDGLLLVLAGDPDADACWDWSLRVVGEWGSGPVLVVDATGSNPTPPAGVELYHVRSSSFAAAADLVMCEDLELWDGGLVVLHSLDCWVDWAARSRVAQLAAYAVVHNLLVILHTKVMGTGVMFGSREFELVAGAVLCCHAGGTAEYLYGRELISGRQR